jgi:site-specific DNA-methyltransferase (adenine-specific)
MPTATTIDCCTLYLGDCRKMLQVLQQATVLITDPPYGMRTRQKRSRDKWVRPEAEHSMIAGDDGPFDPTHLLQLRIPRMILWGANWYADKLPPRGKWLAWDKRRDTTPDDNTDGELAWTTLPGPLRIFRHLWRGIIREGEENVSRAGRLLHPNQKPIALMDWCLQQAQVTTQDTVLDPYMGSGTLGVACLRRGIRYVGIKIDPTYYQSAVIRLQRDVLLQLQQQMGLSLQQPTPSPPAHAAEGAGAEGLRAWGGDRKSQAFREHQGSHVTLKRGNGTAYLTARLRRDHPDIFAAWQQGQFASCRAAARAAGLVKATGAPEERR